MHTVRSGSFVARIVHLYDPKYKLERGHVLEYTSCELRRLTRGKARFTMDVVCAVGMMRYLENRSREDTCGEMRWRHGVPLSAGTVSNHALEFLARFELYHRRHFGRLVEAMDKNGGYVLGADGTGDGGSDRILLLMDLLTGWALSCGPIPSESSKHIGPYFEDIKERAGTPLAFVRDMGLGLRKAGERVFPDLPTRECNYHFLRDVGEDVMEDTYMKLRKAMIDLRIRPDLDRRRKEIGAEAAERDVDLRATMCALKGGAPVEDDGTVVLAETYHLVSWILNYREDAHGLRFPYSIPWADLYRRCRQAQGAASMIARTAERAGLDTGDIETVRRIVERPFNSRESRSADTLGRRLADAYELFSELRGVLRMSEDKGDIPRDQLLVSDEEATVMERELAALRDRLEKVRKERTITPEEEVVLYHIKKHWKGLVVPNITVNVDGKTKNIAVPRAVSLLDTRFGRVKTGIRKRTGRKDTGYELNRYGVLLCLVQNLHSDEYVKTMFGSIDRMPEELGTIPKDEVDRLTAEFKDARCRYDVTRARGEGEFETFKEVCRRVLKDVESHIIISHLNRPLLAGQMALAPTDS
jgi:hypothetical protein